MLRRPPRSTPLYSSAASDVYKRQVCVVGKDGHVKLSDFGLAKQVCEKTPTPTLSFCGSPAYLSPEMLLKKGGNKALDIYGIGTILYEMLTGLPPYYDNDITTMYQNIAYGKLRIPRYISLEARALLKVSYLKKGVEIIGEKSREANNHGCIEGGPILCEYRLE
eukprot:TRINITY_DN9287_c0_g1_i2.p1 TRINITY_DN9287_c0_g1~~TRINITY_DN9287_c0_g1_i2.p1  ORF type:complete len:172 (-),score=41.79 TRINITY_DN9287_c0_g1_i2:184-675(-)